MEVRELWMQKNKAVPYQCARHKEFYHLLETTGSEAGVDACEPLWTPRVLLAWDEASTPLHPKTNNPKYQQVFEIIFYVGTAGFEPATP